MILVTEDKMRFKIFRSNMKKAKELQEKEKGSAHYGASVFADLDEDEFRKFYLTPKWDLKHNDFLTEAKIPLDDAPNAFDWRDHNAVTPVKNQVNRLMFPAAYFKFRYKRNVEFFGIHILVIISLVHEIFSHS